MATKAFVQLVLFAFGGLMLPAFAHSAGTLPNDDASSGIPASTLARPAAGELTAELLLIRLVELIKRSKSVKDFTPDRLAGVMQRPVTFFNPDRFGYRGKLTSEWTYALDVRIANSLSARLDLDFIDRTPDRSAAATGICQVDFDQVASALESDGFARTTIFGEHGIVVYDRFDRPDLSIKVASIGEASLPPEKARHSCVQLVTVQ